MNVLDTEFERRLAVVNNDDTGGLNLFELDDEDDRKWQVAHLDEDEFEERVDEGRYEVLGED